MRVPAVSYIPEISTKVNQFLPREPPERSEGGGGQGCTGESLSYRKDPMAGKSLWTVGRA